MSEALGVSPKRDGTIPSQTQRILEISRDLTTTVSLEHVLHKIVQAAVELTDTEVAGLLLLDERTDELRFMVVSHFSDQLIDIPVPVEKSIAGAALTSGEPVIVPDAHADPRYYKAVEDQVGLVARSLMAVPMNFQQRRIGVLEIENKKDNTPFCDDDVEMLTTLAAQAAVAIENARMVEALRQSHTALEHRVAEREQMLTVEREQKDMADALYRASVALSSTLNYEEVLDRILEQISTVVPHDAANVMLIQDDEAYVFRGHGYEQFGTQTSLTSTGFKVADIPGLRKMQQTLQPLAIPDVDRDETWVYSRPEHRWIKSYAGAPIFTRERVIGFLNVLSATPGALTSADAARLQAFAHHVAIAIENATLYQQAQREIEERERAERQLARHRDHLEELVKARTVDLEAAVTKAQQLNTQLEQKIQEHEQLIAELRAFSHTVAHDLKSPLSLITGYGQMLTHELTTLGQANLLQLAKSMVRTAYKLGRVVDEILTLASVRQAKIEVQPLNMAAIIEEAEARLEQDILESQARISKPTIWPEALGYAPWVEEVWTNYISNALKYGGQGNAGIPPRIELGFDARQLEQEGPHPPENTTEEARADTHIRFWVRDNGAGIAPDAQAQLFTQFTRFDQVRAEGHGLGLSIVKRIVEKLGGQVGVESQIGYGSTFFFTLPATGKAIPTASTITSSMDTPGTVCNAQPLTTAYESLATSLANLGPDLISDLRVAATEGDIARLLSLIEGITAQDKDLGEALDGMAYEFDYRAILALIDAANE